MRRVLRWVGYVLGTLVAIIVVALAIVYAKSSARINHTYAITADTVAVPTDSASIAKGQHLVFAVGKCAGCHGDNLAGKVIANDPAFATIWSANLTRGRGGRGATFTDADYVRAIRYGLHPDGKPLLMMPSDAYTNFSNADLGAIIAYVKSVPPVDQVTPKPRVGPIARIVSTMVAAFPLTPADHVDPHQPRPASVTPSVTREYGNYLVTTGGCKSCHNPNLSGGVKVEGVITANLTPAAIGKWTEADFTKVLRTGVRPDGRILSEVMPYSYTKNLTDDEIQAMWLYVKSLPARPQGG